MDVKSILPPGVEPPPWSDRVEFVTAEEAATFTAMGINVHEELIPIMEHQVWVDFITVKERPEYFKRHIESLLVYFLLK